MVAARLENESGVSIVRDSNQGVRSITFSPTTIERIEGYVTDKPAHAIKITSPVTENVNASPAAYIAARQEYEKLPLATRQLLVDKGFSISIGETMSKALSRKDGTPDPAFGNVADEDRYAAQFFSKENRIVLAETSKGSDGKYQPNQLASLLREEVGEVVDRSQTNRFSAQDSFLKALDNDVSAMPLEIRNRYHRYIVPSQDGPGELFSTEFSLLTRTDNKDFSFSRYNDINRYFKNSENAARALLGSVLPPEQQRRLDQLDKQAAVIPQAQKSVVPGSIDSLAETALKNLALGESGNQDALNQVGRDLWKLDYKSRTELSQRLQWTLGTSVNGGPGVELTKDVIDNVRSMTFYPVESSNPNEKIHPVQIPSPVVENYNSTDAHFKTVQNEAQNLPPKVYNYLQDHNWVIATAHTILEGAPDIDKNSTEPTDVGCNSNDCAAGIEMDYGKRILIPEYTRTPDGSFFHNVEQVPQTVRHEVGHAMDSAFGRISHSLEFVNAYKQDVAAMPQADREKAEYFLQAGWTGPQEMFAELFGIITRRDDSVLQMFDRDRILHKYMKRTEQVIKEKMGDWLDRPS